jgi:hypothetical protein
VFTDSKTIDLQVTASNRPPSARAGGPYFLPEGDTLRLDASGSRDPEGGALTYSWAFQGQTYSGPTVTLPALDVYAGPVTLTVRDAQGAEATDSTLVLVYNVPPMVTAAPLGDRLVTFTDRGPHDTHTATVDWGDGTPPTSGTVQESGGSGSVSAKHVYVRSGTYTVTVTVTDRNGGSGSASFVRSLAFLYLPLLQKPR